MTRRATRRDQIRSLSGGFTFLGLLMSLAIVGILSGMYLAPGPGGAASGPIMYIVRSQRVACEANRAAMRPHLIDFQIQNNRPPTMEDLRRLGVSLPTCPEGGRFYIVDGEFLCTLHTEVIPPEP